MSDGAGRSWFGTARALPERLGAHNVAVVTAGIAFYGLLALVPSLVAVVSIYGLVNQGNEDEIKDQIAEAAGTLDESTLAFVEGQLTDITTSDGNVLALVVGLVLALYSSSGAVQKMMATIATAYEAEENRPGWKVRLLAYALTVGAVVGIVALVTLVGVIPAVLDAVDLGGPAEALIRILQFPIAAVLMAGGLTVLYRYGPDRSPKTPWFNIGAVVATVVWMLFAALFSWYASNIGAMPASYGLLGTVAALMIFLQLTALAAIIGAEVNAVVEQSRAEAGAELGAGGAPVTALAARGGLRGGGDTNGDTPVRPLSLAQAIGGLLALFVLSRGRPD